MFIKYSYKRQFKATAIPLSHRLAIDQLSVNVGGFFVVSAPVCIIIDIAHESPIERLPLLPF